MAKQQYPVIRTFRTRGTDTKELEKFVGELISSPKEGYICKNFKVGPMGDTGATSGRLLITLLFEEID